jgi:ADP-heptose:LPS heptosyltransferase
MVGEKNRPADPRAPQPTEGRQEASRVTAAHKTQQTPPRSVLIIKPSSLGDVVSALPVLRGLRRSFPEARTAWLLSKRYVPLLAHDSDLDEIIVFDREVLGRCWRSWRAAGELFRLMRTLRGKKFDWVIDLQGLFRSAFFAGTTRAPLRAGLADGRECAAVFYTHRFALQAAHTVDRNVELARQLGIDARREDLTLQISPQAARFAEEFCGRHGLRRRNFLICFPPTRWKTKLYPPRHWHAAVAEISRRAPVVLLGAPAERELCGSVAVGAGQSVINAAGQTGISEMVATIAASAGVICSDSAAQFIAAAVGVDCVVLVGPTRVDLTGPLRGKALVADIPCHGCLKRSCSHVTCMQLISPADVAQAATAMLSSGSQ